MCSLLRKAADDNDLKFVCLLAKYAHKSNPEFLKYLKTVVTDIRIDVPQVQTLVDEEIQKIQEE